MIPSFSPANMSTNQIQKYLDENKNLIQAITENQNLGKLAECAQYQAQLQKNLMYLAAIADSQLQVATLPAQMAPHPGMQQGAYHPMAQHPGVFPPRMPTHAQYSNPFQIHDQDQQHQQTIQGQMNLTPIRPSNGRHTTQSNASIGGGSSVGHPTPVGASDSHRPISEKTQRRGPLVMDKEILLQVEGKDLN